MRANPTANRVAELKVSGHLMTLDSGMFCIFHAPGGGAADDGSGLPGVRISLPPSRSGPPDAVKISTFRPDGWLDSCRRGGTRAGGKRPGQYPGDGLPVAGRGRGYRTAAAGAAAHAGCRRGGAGRGRGPGQAASGGAPIPASAEIVAHIQRMGDVAGQFGAWTGTRGSASWVEGFAIAPPEGVAPQDLEYQAVLGRGWLSPWIEGGKFCGSRGMALPLLGLNVRLKGNAAKTHECTYFATFVDGSSVGPVPAGEACQADSLAALEAFQIVLRRRGTATAASLDPAEVMQSMRPRAAASASKPDAGRTRAPVPATKPAAAVVKPAAPAPKPAARPAPRPTPRRSR